MDSESKTGAKDGKTDKKPGVNGTADKMTDGVKSGKGRKKRIGRPPAFIWNLAFFFVSVYYRLKYRVSIDKSGLRDLKGPAVVLAPHISGKDHILTGLALGSHRPTYVLSWHFMAKRALRRLLLMMRVIPKKMFCPDPSSVIAMMRAVREGNILVLFPEGRLTWYGRSLAVTAGTSSLLRRLGADVYVITSDGAGLTFPKWAPKPHPGRINIRTQKLFEGSDLRDMSEADIGTAVDAAIYHDEETAMPGVRFASRDTTAGLDRILWRCPVCGGEHTLDCSHGGIRCRECALDCRLDEYYRLSGMPETLNIHSVADFYENNAASLDLDAPLSYDVEVGATDGDGYMCRGVGTGHLTLSRMSLDFSGNVFGRGLSFSLPAASVVAFPVTVGDHIDVYYDGVLYYLSPLPDRRDAIKLVAYLDRVSAEGRAAAGKTGP